MNEIDVKDCCYYNSDNEPYCCELYDNECEAQNCYYKQLQHLKIENEELKEKNNSIHSIAGGLQQRNHNLTLENEELRKENQEMYKIGCENFVAIDQAKRLYKLNKYIDEIEKICKVNPINTCWTALKLCDKCAKKEECGLQSPLAKLDAISNIIKQAKKGE